MTEWQQCPDGGCCGCIGLPRTRNNKHKVNSKGRQQGLKEGDRVLTVNGQPTVDMTHAEVQRVIRESTSAIELQLERSIGNPETNGFNAAQNGNMSAEGVTESRLNALEEDTHAGSWSTSSTSTGSTTIHVSSLNSDDTSSSENVWSPGRKRANLHLNLKTTNEAPVTTTHSNVSVKVLPNSIKSSVQEEDESSPIWQPFGAPYDGPQFRPVKLEVAKMTTAVSQEEILPKNIETNSTETVKPKSPKPPKEVNKSSTSDSTEKISEKDITTEATSTSNSSTTFTKTGWGSHLPPSQSPTITLLQKAREGQISKGAVYIEEKSDSTPIPKNAVLIDQKVTVEGDKVHTDSYYAVPTVSSETTTHNIKAPPKYDGIGPTEYGIPVGLRTGVKEEYASDWYKTMYKSLHRNKFPNDPSQTTVHLGGYMSEPEFERKDKLRAKYTNEYRRKPEKSVSHTTETTTTDKSRVVADTSVVRQEPRREVYRVEPRSIAEYEPGRSSLAEKEFQKHEHLGPVSPRPQQGLNRRWPNVLLSDGYESDSTLIRKTGRNPEVDPDQQKAWYKEIQKGGEIPLIGLRKFAPEKPTDSSNCRSQFSSHVYGSDPPCYNHKHLPKVPQRVQTYTFRANPYNQTSPSYSKMNSVISIKRPAPTPPERNSSTQRISTLTSHKKNFHISDLKHEAPLINGLLNCSRNFASHVVDLQLPPLSKINTSIQSTGINHISPNIFYNGTRSLINCPLDEPTAVYRFTDCNSKLRFKHEFSDNRSMIQSSGNCASTRFPDYSRPYHAKDSFLPTWRNHCPHKNRQEASGIYGAETVLAESYNDSPCLLVKEDGAFAKQIQYCERSPNKTLSNEQNNRTKKAFSNFSSRNNDSGLHIPKSTMQYIQPINKTSIENSDISQKGSLKYAPLKAIREINSSFINGNITYETHSSKSVPSSMKYETLNFKNSTKSIKNGSVKAAIKQYDVPRLAEIIPLPRMITILPPVIQVLPFTNEKFKSQVVHSIPQNYKKLNCTFDLKPLKLYLKKYGPQLPQKVHNSPKHNSTIEMILRDFRKSKLEISDCHMSSFVSKKDDKLLNNSIISLRKPKSLPFPEKTNFRDRILNLDATPNKATYWKSIPFAANKHETSISTCFTHHLPNVDSSSRLSRKNFSNISLNQQNAIIYHEYIASMLSSASKSQSFVKLRNFYSSLENLTDFTSYDGNNPQQIDRINISWKKISYYQRWNKNQDRSLKVRHSSVEDLRDFFQNSNTRKCSKSYKTTFEMSFQYKRLLYTVSVSTLVERYNNMQCFHQMKIHSKLSDSIISPPRYNYCNKQVNNLNSNTLEISQKIVSPLNYQLPVWNSYAYHLNKSDHTLLNISRIIRKAKKCTSPVSFENRQMAKVSPDIQSKVKLFEHNSYERRCPNVAMEACTRNSNFKRNNLSCCDLRQIDDNLTSSSYSNLFSPNYLPEKAMSCLDLSSMSMDSFSTEQSINYGNRSSSSMSFASSECTTKDIDILQQVIRTGTVEQIKNKLENSLELMSPKNQNLALDSKSKSSSVPNNLPFVTSRSNSNRIRRSFLPNKSFTSMSGSSGSVQNLIQKFEPNLEKTNTFPRKVLAGTGYQRNRKQNDALFPCEHKNVTYQPYMRASSFDLSVTTESVFKDEANDKISCSRYISKVTDDSLKSEVRHSMKKRIQNLISRFENRESYTIPKFHTFSHRCNTDSRTGSSIINKVCNFSTNFKASSVGQHERKAHLQTTFTSAETGSGKFIFRNEFKNSNHSSLLYKGFLKPTQMNQVPRVQNSSPRPYVKTGRALLDNRTASPHQYQETEVNIHYRSPIRHLEKEYIEEEELRRRQEDAMLKLYEEERRKKHHQEMAEIEMRRHSDFFTPSQKSPIPLNRYDNPFDSGYRNRLAPPGFSTGPAPKTMARAMYPFISQTNRELSLNKGDIVYINKQIDKNWFEGEHHGLVGIFPASYVEIIPTEKANLQPRKAIEGEALVKYNFRAQSPVELSLFKGERVILTKKMDQNWFEGRLGTKKGIFPISYVEVLQEPGEHPSGTRTVSPKPPASPIFGSIINGSPPKAKDAPIYNTGLRPLQNKPPLHLDKSESKALTQSLHIDTYNEPIPYRSLYSYKPQNDDELELKEGDTVYVMEKCDDGWYVGTSLRTGLFGTFPGNYVERI